MVGNNLNPIYGKAKIKEKLGLIFPSRFHVKPTFLGIGVAKAGTTGLSKLLAKHPDINFPIGRRKEVHFFDEYLEPDSSWEMKDINWYFSLFDKNKAVGEFTPSYLFVPECRDRIFETLGSDVKFIVALRNPVDRAYSHYCHAVNNWHSSKYKKLGYPTENLSFEEALMEEQARLQEGKYHIRHLSYFNKGLYAKQLKWYFEVFPKENFYIYLFEDYIKNPHSILSEICNFIGVDDDFDFPKIKKTNSQTKGDLSPETRQDLFEKYRCSIDELEQLLDIDLSCWRI